MFPVGTRGRAKGKRHVKTESFLFTVKTLAFPETPGCKIPVMSSRAVLIPGLHVLPGKNAGKSVQQESPTFDGNFPIFL